jgi:glycosyltransferase involved in cell wall biosynthesis
VEILNDSKQQSSSRDFEYCSVREKSSMVEKAGKGKRVILIAIALDQNYGSEPGTGWLALKSHVLLGNYVTIITTPSVENNFKFDLTFSQSKVRFTTVDSKFLREIKQLPFFSDQIYSIFWNVKAKKVISNLIHLEKFDLIHHATYTGDWNYSAIHSIKTSIPRIWGPVGSASRFSKKVVLNSRFKGFSKQFVKLQIENMFRSELRKRAVKKNIKVFAQNIEIQNYFSEKIECKLIPMIALPHLKSSMRWNSPNSNYFFGSGRMIKFKNWTLTIEALRFLPDDYLLILTGDGPDLKRLKKYAKSSGLENRIIFTGHLTYEECLNLLLRSKAFVFPSYGDSLGWSLGEAIHFGVPVISLATTASETLTREISTDLIKIGPKSAQNFALQMLNPTKHNGFNQFCLCRVLNEFEKLIDA